MRIKKFTKVGNYNSLRGVENQDYICVKENKRFLVVALADGATSCVKGAAGARIACEAASGMLIKSDKWFDFEKEKVAYLILEEVLFQTKKEADKNNEPLEAYASTLVITLFDKKKNRLLVFNLGDGAVFLSFQNDIKYNPVVSPKRFEGQPSLITCLDSYKDAQVVVLNEFDGKIFMCSDGVYEILFKKGITIAEFIKEPEKWDLEDDGSFLFYET
ncbi:MAG: protein phosphatase 2C domain-containing protein [Clostridia bacterium]|nr:protein phosphatase 2C domain-containing protein [Clostridia bacterium]